jgi:mannosylglycerate hydrolase
VRFDNEHVRMTAFKKAEERESAILRLFNTTDATISLNMDVPAFKQAWLTNLAEVRERELTVKDGKIALEIPAKKILTIELA